MGCHVYRVEVPLAWSSDKPDEPMSRNEWFYFSEDNEEVACLCTFPAGERKTLSISTLRSIAYLGAAVVLAHQRIVTSGEIPGCLPDWIKDEIDRILHYAEEYESEYCIGNIHGDNG